MTKQNQLNSNNPQQFTETESTVSRIWSEVLQLDDINLKDNFFELGGDSLMIMMVMFRVNDELDIELPPSAIGEYPTLSEFCRFIESNRSGFEAQSLLNESQFDSSEEESGVI